MGNFNCSESMTRVCKAYATDFYSHIADAYNKCKSGDRQILKKNIFDILDRMKYLLDNKNIIEDEEDYDDEIENNSVETD